MERKPEILISRVELSEDGMHLSLHTRNDRDCNCLWSQLAGQAMNRTEGNQPILYNMPEEPPESLVLEIESSPDQLVLLLEHLEIDLKNDAFLAAGTTERIRQQIAFFGGSAQLAIHQEVLPLSEKEAGDEKKPTLK